MTTGEPQRITLTQRLDWLVDQWCERRALRPLRSLLPCYPGQFSTTHQIRDLLDALCDVKTLYPNQLTPEELTHVTAAINELENLLKKK